MKPILQMKLDSLIKHIGSQKKKEKNVLEKQTTYFRIINYKPYLKMYTRRLKSIIKNKNKDES